MWGISRKADGLLLKTVVNFGHRGTLQANHPFRFVGASRKCCPIGYYEGTQKSIEDLKQIVAKFDVKEALMNYEIDKLPIATHNTSRLGCDGSACYKGLKFSTADKLYNEGFTTQDFMPFLCFSHCDFREPIIYERRDDLYYLENGKKRGAKSRVKKSSEKQAVGVVAAAADDDKIAEDEDDDDDEDTDSSDSSNNADSDDAAADDDIDRKSSNNQLANKKAEKRSTTRNKQKRLCLKMKKILTMSSGYIILCYRLALACHYVTILSMQFKTLPEIF
jgi:hypothetical protein